MVRKGKQALFGVRVEERVKVALEEMALQEGRSTAEIFRVDSHNGAVLERSGEGLI